MLLFVVIATSVAVGFRSLDVGKDSAQYARHFYTTVETNGLVDNFEIGFSSLMYVAGKISKDVSFFFTLVAFIISLTYISLFSKIFFTPNTIRKIQYIDICIIFSLLFVSSWYLAFTTNGIRQGIALPLLYTSIYYLLFENNKTKFVYYFITSVLFHLSGLFTLPFLFLIKLKKSFLWLVWLVLLLGYFFGINELIVEYISDNTGLPLYRLIKYYAVERGGEPGSGLYYGFDWRFVLYTMFWPLIGEAVIFINKKFKSLDSSLLGRVINIYLCLNMAYFFFGFGAYSNRYAAMSWFFIPLLQFGIVRFSGIKLMTTYFAVLVFFFAFLNHVMINLKYV